MILHRLRVAGLGPFVSETTIDFDALGPGIVAVAGGNGVGKTTLVSLCGPGALYRQIPWYEPGLGSRANLADFVVGESALLELSFGLGEHEWTIEHSFRGERVTAKLAKDGVPVVSGKLKEFDEAIEELVGPRDAWYASVFGVQGGSGSFASLDHKGRKAVFSHYLRLGRLERLHAATCARMRECAADRKALTTVLEDLPALERRAKDLERDLRGHQVVLADARVAAQDAAGALEKLRGAREALKTADAILRQRARLEDEIARAVASAERAVVEMGRLEAEAEAAAGREPLDVEALRARLSAAREKEKLAIELRGLHEAAVRESAMAIRAVDLVGRVPCRGEGRYAECELLGDAAACARDVVGARRRSQELRQRLDETKDGSTEPGTLERLVRSAEKDERDAEVRRAKSTAGLERARATFADAEAAVERFGGELRELPAVPELPVSAEEIKVAVVSDGAATVALRTAEHRDAELRGMLSEAKLAVERTEQRKAELEKATADVDALKYLDRALGPNGIPAMEIEVAGPEIGETIDELLSSTFGGRFSVSIRTTTELKSRDGTKEDFAVVVWDQERERSGDPSDYSGGEQTILDEAIRTALSVFASRRLPVRIRTLWRDEPSAALDEGNAHRYVRMLRRAMELADFRQVLLVSHDPVVLGGADATIRLGGGA